MVPDDIAPNAVENVWAGQTEFERVMTEAKRDYKSFGACFFLRRNRFMNCLPGMAPVAMTIPK